MKKVKDSIWFLPFVVFVAIMTAVVSSYIVSTENRRQEREITASDYSKVIENDVRQQVEILEEVLRSEVGFVTVNKRFSKEDWRLSIEASRVLERYPGIQGIGYIEVVQPGEKQTYEREARRTVSPEFAIYPEGVRDIYTAIRYLEPQHERNDKAIGYDMYSEEVRRTAMSLARDNNDVFITDPVSLVQENGVDQQLGLLLYAPSYTSSAKIDTLEQRRQSIEGYVYIVLHTRDFFSNLLQDKNADNMGFSLYAIGDSDDHVLYQSDSFQALSDKETVDADHIFSVKGSSFGIAAAYDPQTVLPESILARSSTVLFSGSFAAFLITGMTYLLLRGRANQLALAQERSINDAKDSLLSIASHQLRTPATGVKQYLGMVLQGFVGDVSDQQKTMLEKAYESNERQLKTINDVLFLARLDSGRIVLSKKETDMNAMLDSVIEEQQKNSHDSGHTIKKIVPRKKVTAMVDEHTVRMTVENLLSNAVKYTKNDGKITIALKQNANETLISVSDNGVGIAKEDEAKLFKQFSRVPNALSKSVSGTGIGLYLAKHIIDLHGGEIIVESEQYKGSTFTIVLPA